MGTGYTEDPPNPPERDVQQRQWPVEPIPVKPVGPVGVEELPADKGAAFTEVLTTTMRKILAGPDPKRKQVIMSCDGDILISFSGSTGSGARFHGAAAVGPIIPLTYTGAIYAQAVTGTVNLGVIAEYWAD